MVDENGPRRVRMGRIHGLFGVRGWVKVYSHTVPPENILDYPVWQVRVGDGWRALRVLDGRPHGKTLVAYLADSDGQPIDDRDAAAALLDAEIAVARDELPPAEPGTYYWADLIGCRVHNLEGEALGEVEGLVETGANDVLVVRGERERMVPFVRDLYLKEVDLDARRVLVDWDPDW